MKALEADYEQFADKVQIRFFLDGQQYDLHIGHKMLQGLVAEEGQSPVVTEVVRFPSDRA